MPTNPYEPPEYTNVEIAQELIASSRDPVEREFLSTALTVLTFKLAPDGPDQPFDVAFFLRVLKAMLDERKRLSRVLAGEVEAE